jgi:hypothetical protein
VDNFVCCILFERGVIFCVLCRIVIPLPPGKNRFAVELNNDNNIKITSLSILILCI